LSLWGVRGVSPLASAEDVLRVSRSCYLQNCLPVTMSSSSPLPSACC
jgi:hypothetical protein